MASQKLTDGLVEGVQSGDSDQYVWDTALPRFGVRITPAGARIYLIQYRAKGAPGEKPRTRRITIGRHDGEMWNVTKARAHARKLLAPVDLGHDPFADRQAARQDDLDARLASHEATAAKERQAQRESTETFSALLDVYVKRRLAQRRSGFEAERLLRYGPEAVWGSRHVSAIKRSDLADFLETTRSRAPAVARSTFAELRTFFSWCIEREVLGVNPCSAVRAPPRPEARDRVLSDDELRIIWLAADQIGFPFGPAVKLLMLTGQRRAEVAGMRRDELDMAAGTWRIPASRTKNAVAHEIDLAPAAIEVLKDVPDSGALVFPARGEGALRGFSAGKRKLDGAVEAIRTREAAERGLEAPAPLNWRLHDLRRTAATGMAGLGFAPHIVERVLNHVSTTNAGLVGVYQRFEYRAERRAALLAWAANVTTATSGVAPPSNIHQLRSEASVGA